MPIQHTVRRGECVASIAFAYGYFPDAIWQAPENEALRQRRASANVLAIGDVLVIPDKQPKLASIATDQRHEFRRKGVPEKLQLQFMIAGEVRDEELYELRIDGAIVAADAMTDSEGRIEHFISPVARRAEVRFLDSGDTHVFALGDLDPIDSVAGVQSRLESLGYPAGPRKAEIDHPQLRRALTDFQLAHDLDPSGVPDDPTVAALQREYGV